jgi:hypothetical protein
MSTKITTFGDSTLQRTIQDPVPKPVQPHTQPPVGKIVCPHCHEDTNTDAIDLYSIIGQPHPWLEYLAKPLEKHPAVHNQTLICTVCTGSYNVGKQEQNLRIWPLDVPESVLKAEEILARKAAEQASPQSI